MPTHTTARTTPPSWDHPSASPSSVFGLLRCPTTGHPMTFFPAADQPLPGHGFGVLHGGKGPYPVVDGVPILQHGRVTVRNHVTGAEEATGPEVMALVSLLETGHSLDALLDLLTVTPSPQWRGRHVPGSGRLLSHPRLRAVGRWVRRRHLRTRLGHGRRTGTLQWWSSLFHTHSQGINDELVHYFAHRTTQPRYLAALAATRAALTTYGVVLDLACGYGHLSADILTATTEPTASTRDATAEGAAPTPPVVVGVDRTYFQLWLATHFVAPGALFVCADAATTLPLPAGSVDAVVCSDAFHYLPAQSTVLSELLRVCPTGPIALTRVGNLDHEPHEGLERTAAGWAELLGDHHHLIVDEDHLVHHYLDRTPVDPVSDRDLAAAKWLTLLLSGDPDTALTAAAPDRWPHQHGPLRINPLYTQHARTDGGLDLELRMPSRWYEFENHALRTYHATTATLSPSATTALRAGQHHPDHDTLTEQFVLLGAATAPGKLLVG